MLSVELLMAIDIDFVAVALAVSVTRNVKEPGPPVVVGVPEITPPELSDSPAGNVPEVTAQV